MRTGVRPCAVVILKVNKQQSIFEGCDAEASFRCSESQGPRDNRILKGPLGRLLRSLARTADLLALITRSDRWLDHFACCPVGQLKFMCVHAKNAFTTGTNAFVVVIRNTP